MKILFLFFVLLLSCCTKKSGETVTKQELKGGQEEQLFQRGKAIYNSNCISCHNIDPKMVGSVGPAVSGSSFELLEARILRATYPAGYKAQRETQQMPALPHLKNEIQALSNYLK